MPRHSLYPTLRLVPNRSHNALNSSRPLSAQIANFAFSSIGNTSFQSIFHPTRVTDVPAFSVTHLPVHTGDHRSETQNYGSHH